MGSCPLLTPPAGGWILDSRINKAILKCVAIVAENKPKSNFECAAIAAKNKPKSRFKTHQKAVCSRQNAVCTRHPAVRKTKSTINP